MYEELISRLKNLAMLTTENGESEIRISTEAVQAIREIATEAADAIEELSNLVDAQIGIIKQYQAYLQKQRWISVEERLPEDDQVVYICGILNAVTKS